MRRGLLCLVFLVAPSGSPARPAASGTEVPVSVTLEAPGKPLKAGTDLVLQATVKNTSDHEVLLPTSPGLVPEDGFRYKIEALDAGGHPAQESARVLALRQGKGPRFGNWSSNIGRTLKPGQSLVEEINVTRYYDLSRPGTYTIWVIRPLPLQVPPWAAKKYWKGSVRSNTITVTVVK
jgi:hypothetical protein